MVNELDDAEQIESGVLSELEPLKLAAERIKNLEIELDEARSNYRLLLSDSSSQINIFAEKLGSCIEKAKKCTEGRIFFQKIENETDKNQDFESIGLKSHLPTAQEESEKILQQLNKELKKSIVKSSLSTRRSLLQLNNLANQHQLQLLPYFEMKTQFNQLLEEQKKKIYPLEENILKNKVNFDDTLNDLNEDSDESYSVSEKKFLDFYREYEIDDELSNSNWNGSTSSNQRLKSSYLSSDDAYLDDFALEDTFMALPPSMKVKPELLDCMTSHLGDSGLKSFDDQSSDEDTSSTVEESSTSTSHDSTFNTTIFEKTSNL